MSHSVPVLAAREWETLLGGVFGLGAAMLLFPPCGSHLMHQTNNADRSCAADRLSIEHLHPLLSRTTLRPRK